MTQNNSSSPIRKHVYLPVPNPKNLSKEPLSKREVLSAILQNLEKSHFQVRDNIVSSAIATREAQPTIPQPYDGSAAAQTNRAAAITLLISNLNAPAPSQDPCVPPTGYIPAPPTSLIQEPPPPETLLAIQTASILDDYDRHAQESHQFYQRALERLDDDASTHRRRSSGAHPIAPPTSSRPASTLGYGPANAAPGDPSR